MTTEEKFLFPGQSHVHKLYSATWFKCTEERHVLRNKHERLYWAYGTKKNLHTVSEYSSYFMYIHYIYKLILNNILQKQLRVYFSS